MVFLVFSCCWYHNMGSVCLLVNFQAFAWICSILGVDSGEFDASASVCGFLYQFQLVRESLFACLGLDHCAILPFSHFLHFLGHKPVYKKKKKKKKGKKRRRRKNRKQRDVKVAHEWQSDAANIMWTIACRHIQHCPAPSASGGLKA